MSEQESRSQVVPVLTAALVCDVAATDPANGKVSVLGIYDRVISPRFPVARPFCVYVRLSDADGLYELKIELVESLTNSVLTSAVATLNAPGRSRAFDFYVTLGPVEFREPGHYTFQVSANDIYLGSAPIMVEGLPETPRET